jgi:hypothetical protein
MHLLFRVRRLLGPGDNTDNDSFGSLILGLAEKSAEPLHLSGKSITLIVQRYQKKVDRMQHEAKNVN